MQDRRHLILRDALAHNADDVIRENNLMLREYVLQNSTLRRHSLALAEASGGPSAIQSGYSLKNAEPKLFEHSVGDFLK